MGRSYSNSLLITILLQNHNINSQHNPFSTKYTHGGDLGTQPCQAYTSHFRRCFSTNKIASSTVDSLVLTCIYSNGSVHASKIFDKQLLIFLFLRDLHLVNVLWLTRSGTHFSTLSCPISMCICPGQSGNAYCRALVSFSKLISSMQINSILKN